MTINECVSAARECVPVVMEDLMLGPMLFGRIKEITKTYRTPSEVERGKAPEAYYLTLESMRCPGQSQHVCPPEMVRRATAEDIVQSGIPDELKARQQIAARAEALRAAEEE